MSRRLAAAALALVLGGCAAPPANDDRPPLGAAARERLAALGPWPPAPADVPAAQVALGEALFHSSRLSAVGGLRCASCHEPWRHYTDGRERALGAAEGTRNTPSLLNVRLLQRFGWEGANTALEAQSVRPMLDPREMRSDAAHIGAALRDDAQLAALYRAAHGAAPPADDAAALQAVARALADYQTTLTSPRTPFDDFRDAVLDGAPAPYPTAAQRGLELFVGQAGCVACHAGPAFSDSALHGRFRTPALREVAHTAPYLHDGSAATLCDAVRPHAQPAGLALSAAERSDLVAFLGTLSGSAPAPARCR